MTRTGSSQFSVLAFALALVTVSCGTAAGLSLVPIAYGSSLGTLVGGLVAGLAVEDRPLIETGIAAVLAGLGVLVTGPLVGTGLLTAVLALGSISPTALLTSVVLSFALGAFGAHFGHEIRDGLTEPVEEPSGSRSLGTVGSPPASRESTDTTLEDTDSVDDESVAGEDEADEMTDADSEPDRQTAPEAEPELEFEGPEETDR